MHSRAIFVLCAIFGALLFVWNTQNAHATVDTFTSSGTWTAPAGVTSVSAEAWGGGGGGSGFGGGGGGGGGAYSIKSITVVPGNVYTVTVGGGGAGGTSSGSGTDGGDSWFNTSGTIFAQGGKGGVTTTGGAGGASSSGIGDTVFSGGSGGAGENGGFFNLHNSGGGGSSAGTASDGNNGADAGFGGGSGGVAPTGGAAGGAGANTGQIGSNGSNYGGAGGGGDGTGGDGAGGKVVLTYTAGGGGSTTVTNVTSSTSNGSYKAGSTISIQVTFSATVTVTGTPQLTLETGSTNEVVNYASGSGSSTLTFTYTVQVGDTSSDLDYVSAASLALNGGTIKDGSSNDAVLTLPTPGAAGSLGANKNIIIDTTAPTVTNVTSSTSNGSYKAGSVISIQATFSETVNVSGTPQLTLETGTTDETVNYASGSGSSTLTFTYTVQAGDKSSDLDYTSTSALTLNSGTIRDAALNDATLTLASPGASGSLGANKDIVIDTTAPTVTTLSPANGATGVSPTANLIITFSESVTAVAAKNLTIKKTSDDSVVETISVTGGLVSGSGGSTITINPSTTLDENTGYYVLIDSGAFTDTATNAYAGISSTTAWAFTTGAFDTTAPTLLSFTTPTDNGTYGPGRTITIVATYDETVSSDSRITITLDNGKKIILNTASGSTLTGTYQVGNTGSGEDSSHLTVSKIYTESVLDTSGNKRTDSTVPSSPNNLADSSKLVIDTTAPAVSLLTPKDNSTNVAINSKLVIKFSDPVFVGNGTIIINNVSGSAVAPGSFRSSSSLSSFHLFSTQAVTIDDRLIAASSSLVTGSGTDTITIDPGSDLQKNAGYSVQVSSNAFEDANGNFYTGISDITTWNFFTGSSSILFSPTPTPTPSPTPVFIGIIPCPPGSLTCDRFNPSPTPTPSSTPEPSPSPSPTPGPTPTQNPESSPPPTNPITPESLKKIINSTPAKITTIAVTATALMGIIASTSPLLSTFFSDTYELFQKTWQGFFSFFGLGKKRRPWGRVIDADTGEPVPAAHIEIYDHQMKQLKGTMFSNDRGAFSLIAPPGSYEFRAQKTGWVLTPSAPYVQLFAGEHVYDGKSVLVTKEKLLPIVLAMRLTDAVPVTLGLIWRRISQSIILFISRLSWPSIILGLLLNSLAVWISPAQLNVGIEVLYVVLIAVKILLRFVMGSAVGYIRDAVTNKPLDLAVIRLYEAGSGRLIETRTTGRNGKFLFLPPLGVYTIMIVRSGYEPYKESHIVVSQKKEALALSFTLQPIEKKEEIQENPL